MASTKATKAVKLVAPTSEHWQSIIDDLNGAKKSKASMETKMEAIIDCMLAVATKELANAKPKAEPGTKGKSSQFKSDLAYAKGAPSNPNSACNNVEVQKILDAYGINKDNIDVKLKPATPAAGKTVAVATVNALRSLKGFFSEDKFEKKADYYNTLAVAILGSAELKDDFKAKITAIYKTVTESSTEAKTTSSKKKKVNDSDSDDEEESKEKSKKSNKKTSKKPQSDDEDEDDDDEDEEEEEPEEEAPKAKAKPKAAAKSKGKKVADDDSS